MYIFDFVEENKSILSKIKDFIFNIYWVLFHPSSYIKKAIKGKKNYVRPISLSPDIEGDHEHICFAIRLLGKNYKYFCPNYNKKDFEPEWGCNDYDCDLCEYCGTIEIDENKKFKLYIQDEFGELYSLKEFKNND